jgi:hypothetical protein
MLKHLSLEYWPPRSDLLAAGFAPPWRVGAIVRHEPGFLGLVIDPEEEHLREKVQELELVGGNAAEEHRSVAGRE